MIWLTIQEEPEDELSCQFTLHFQQAGRVVVTLDDEGHLVAHVYDGAADKPDDEPIGGYDNAEMNQEWDYPS